MADNLLDLVGDIFTGIYFLISLVSYVIVPLFPLILSVWYIVRFSGNRAIIVDDARSLRTKDLMGVGWSLLFLFILTVLVEVVLWILLIESNKYQTWQARYIWDRYIWFDEYQTSRYIWYDLLMLTITCIFAWWWLRLKRANVNGAFTLAVGGWLIASVVLILSQNIFMEDLEETWIATNYVYVYALVLAVALGILGVLVVEVKRGMRYASLIVFLLALLLALVRLLSGSPLGALYLMVVSSLAISNWVLISRPAMIVGSGISRMLAFLVLLVSVALAVFVFGVVPLMMVAPEWVTGAAEWGSGVGVGEMLFMHVSAWTAPFIVSAAVYIVVKRISIDRIGIEWASLSWLILNFMAVFWTAVIAIDFSVDVDPGLVQVVGYSEPSIGIAAYFSIGIAALGAVVLIFSLLLGRGAKIRPLFAALTWVAVLYASGMNSGSSEYSEIPEVIQVLYIFELALTLAMVFVITCLVFGEGLPRIDIGSSKKVVSSGV